MFSSQGDDKVWNLDSPLKDFGDENMMTGILNGITSAKFDQTLEGEDPKTFGLDNPKIVPCLVDSCKMGR